MAKRQKNTPKRGSHKTPYKADNTRTGTDLRQGMREKGYQGKKEGSREAARSTIPKNKKKKK